MDILLSQTFILSEPARLGYESRYQVDHNDLGQFTWSPSLL